MSRSKAIAAGAGFGGFFCAATTIAKGMMVSARPTTEDVVLDGM